MRLNLSSKVRRITVWSILFCLLLSTFTPSALAGATQLIFAQVWFALTKQGQITAVQARPGRPEEELPNVSDARSRILPLPRAPLPLPSTIRSLRNPLVPWDGRRVGDPLPLLGQRFPSTSEVKSGTISGTAGERRNLGGRGKQTVPAKPTRSAHHARIKSSAPPAPPLPDDQYIQNFFYWALLRYPNGTEPTYWNDIFRAAHANSQSSKVMATRELGKALFESSEYAARGRDNHWFVYDLYKTFLMREPDAPGWAF